MDIVSDTELPAGSGSEAVEALIASGALDDLFARIDAGDVEMTGNGGLIPELIKAALERGLQAELTDHLGYERGDPDAALFANSRNGFTAKTVATQVGEIELATPRDRDGSFTPRLVPKGTRRLGGLDEIDAAPSIGTVGDSFDNAMAESVFALFKTELHRNPAALKTNGGHWRGLDDLEIATCAWVSWFNEERLHGELDDRTPAEIEDGYYRQHSQPNAA
jgi:hypothetical protein